MTIVDQYFSMMEHQSGKQAFFIAKCLFNKLISTNKYNGTLDEKIRSHISQKYKFRVHAFCVDLIVYLTSDGQFQHQCLRPRSILDCMTMEEVINPEKRLQFHNNLILLSTGIRKCRCSKCLLILKFDLNLYEMRQCIFV